MSSLVLLSALVCTSLAQSTRFPMTFTGNAERDFVPRTAKQSNFAQKLYPVLVALDDTGEDVGVPPRFPFPVSGWDMKDLRFAYDYAADIFSFSINCFGVCGDADGDGNPNVASMALLNLGGADLAAFATTESCAMALDIGGAGSAEPDGVMDFIVGYPAEIGVASDRFPCMAGGNMNFDAACFGLYKYDQSLGTKHIGQRFIYKENDPVLTEAFAFAVDQNKVTSGVRPDLEWQINNFNRLHELAGIPKIDRAGVIPFAFNIAAFCGSFADDGVGEDTFPNDGPFQRIDWPCFIFDPCDVCGGDGSTCADCAGVPNGTGRYDICDVCNGRGGNDCRGVPCGPAVYDCCDVCQGDGSTCTDCRGVCNGRAVYDRCDVCGGDGRSCLDCKGVPFGRASYDKCDVCEGTNKCVDCQGVPNGPAEFDECGVCEGDGTACLDCTSNCFNLAKCYFPSLFDKKGAKIFAFESLKTTGACKNC